MRATRALINTSNLKHNLEIVKKTAGNDVKICLAVKADAYGHGAVETSKAALSSGVEYLAVAAVCEAEELRESGIASPIIILSSTLPEEIETLISLKLDTVVSTAAEVRRLAKAAEGRKLNIHLKIDTGMGRIGCTPDEAVKLAEIISECRGFSLTGICTHFPVSDSSAQDDIEYTRKQISDFSAAVKQIRDAGIDPGIIHAANSGAILNYPESHFDMVRPGILAYGYLPGREEGLISEKASEYNLLPVMSMESRLMHIKKVPAETFISYGRKYRTTEETWIGTIPVGYADGYTRSLSNKAEILIDGNSYPIAGTVCMDQLMVNLGKTLKVELFDRAVIFGSEEGAATAESLTAITGTIPYELLCGISKRVPRVFI